MSNKINKSLLLTVCLLLVSMIAVGEEKVDEPLDGTDRATLPQAVLWHLEKAEAGEAEAQYNIGNIYETGFGVSADAKEAAKWYEKAAEQDHPQAQFNLGVMYILGNGVRKSNIRGSRYIRAAAKNKNKVAVLLYDKVLSPNAVIEINVNDTVKKVRKAYDRGEKRALKTLNAILAKQEEESKKHELSKRFTGPSNNSIGKEITIKDQKPEFLSKGKLANIPQPAPDNVALLMRDANAGNANAQFQLARMYEFGDKVDINRGEAIKWYSSSAGLGHKDSQYRLGIAYLFGSGVPQNLAKGREWLAKASSQKHEVATSMLSLLSLNGNGNKSIALSWYLERALHGDGDAQLGLGYMFENGWGIEPNVVESKNWYTRARSSGSGTAARKLRQIRAQSASRDPDPDPESVPKMPVRRDVMNTVNRETQSTQTTIADASSATPKTETRSAFREAEIKPRLSTAPSRVTSVNENDDSASFERSADTPEISADGTIDLKPIVSSTNRLSAPSSISSDDAGHRALKKGPKIPIKRQGDNEMMPFYLILLGLFLGYIALKFMRRFSRGGGGPVF